MADLLIPQHIADEEFADWLNARTDEQMREVELLNQDLKRIDPSLSIVMAGENATETDHPGCFHLRKRIPGSVDAHWPLVGPNGEFRYPGQWVLDMLQAEDVWNPRIHRSKKEAKEKLRETRQRAKARKEEQRRDEMEVAVRAAKRLRGDNGMTQRTDLKRAGVGIKKPAKSLILPGGAK